MNLGPIQQYWVSELRNHPERQTYNILGFKEGDTIRACCLGQAKICLDGDDAFVIDSSGRTKIGSNSLWGILSPLDTDRLGLRSGLGDLSEDVSIGNNHYYSLADMNDKGMTWLEIVDFIENNPELVFTEPK